MECKRRGVLLSLDGVERNILKIKPPMVFNKENSDLLVKTVFEVMQEMN